MKGFSIKTEIEEYDTFEQFAKEAQLGEKDLVLCGEHTYKQYVEPLSLGVQTLFREKYGKGEPTDGAVDAILDALRDKNFDRIVAIGGGTVIDIAKAAAVAGPEDKVDSLSFITSDSFFIVFTIQYLLARRRGRSRTSRAGYANALPTISPAEVLLSRSHKPVSAV